MTEFTICEPGVMEAELAGVRERGFATDRQENEIGAYCVGMPVFGPFDQIVASISVSGVINRMTPDLVTEIVGLLRDLTGRSHKPSADRGGVERSQRRDYHTGNKGTVSLCSTPNQLSTQLYCAVLSDVMDDLGLMEQAMQPFVRPVDDARVLMGRARTGLFADVYAVQEGENPYKYEIELLDDLKPGDVLVLACGGPTDRIAPWVDLLTTAAIARAASAA